MAALDLRNSDDEEESSSLILRQNNKVSQICPRSIRCNLPVLMLLKGFIEGVTHHQNEGDVNTGEQKLTDIMKEAQPGKRQLEENSSEPTKRQMIQKIPPTDVTYQDDNKGEIGDVCSGCKTVQTDNKQQSAELPYDNAGSHFATLPAFQRQLKRDLILWFHLEGFDDEKTEANGKEAGCPRPGCKTDIELLNHVKKTCVFHKPCSFPRCSSVGLNWRHAMWCRRAPCPICASTYAIVREAKLQARFKSGATSNKEIATTFAGIILSLISKEESAILAESVASTPFNEDSTVPAEIGTSTSTKEDSTSPVEIGTSTSAKEDSTSPAEIGTSISAKEDSTSPAEIGTSTSAKEDSTSPAESGTIDSTSSKEDSTSSEGCVSSTRG